MSQQQYIVRANKGKARIWLEGKRLTAAGFTQGTRYHVSHVSDGMVLGTDPEGAKKVSGKASGPIIDLSGKGCGILATGDNVTINYFNGTIIIKLTK